MIQDIDPFMMELRDDAVTASQLKFKAIRVQISAERPTLSWATITNVLLALEAEGPNPVWDTLVYVHGDPLNGNTTINRRLRALADRRKGIS